MLVVRGLECSCAKSRICAGGGAAARGRAGGEGAGAGAAGGAGAGDAGRTAPTTDTTRSDTGDFGSSSVNKRRTSARKHLTPPPPINVLHRSDGGRVYETTVRTRELSGRSTLVKPVSTARPRLQSVAVKHQASRKRKALYGRRANETNLSARAR